jgi:DNA-binding transcriptional LysR family regulator
MESNSSYASVACVVGSGRNPVFPPPRCVMSPNSRTAHNVPLGEYADLVALIDAGSVTEAARKLGISQSAMSHRLASLRAVTGDPLLIATGRRMIPTPLAERLVAPLREAMLSVNAILLGNEQFDPGTSRRQFRVLSADYGEFVVIPEILRILHETGATISLQNNARTNQAGILLEAAEADIAIGPPMPMPAAVRRKRMLAEPYLVASRKEHGRLAAQAVLDMDTYLACGHVQIAPAGQSGGPVDQALQALGLQREVRLQVAHFSTAPFIILGNDLLLTGPAGLLRRAAELIPLRLDPIPFDVPAIPIFLYWHERMSNDPGVEWLRALVETATRRVWDPDRKGSATLTPG